MPETVQILLDSFPTISYTPDGGRYEPARTVVVDERVEVWVLRSGTSNPEIAYTAPILSVTGNRTAGFDIQTADGNVKVIKAGGCGCGNKLKSFDPFAGASRRIQRLEARR